MSSPYLIEKKVLIKRLMEKLPYSRKWFESKNVHVLNAMYLKHKKNS